MGKKADAVNNTRIRDPDFLLLFFSNIHICKSRLVESFFVYLSSRDFETSSFLAFLNSLFKKSFALLSFALLSLVPRLFLINYE